MVCSVLSRSKRSPEKPPKRQWLCRKLPEPLHQSHRNPLSKQHHPLRNLHLPLHRHRLLLLSVVSAHPNRLLHLPLPLPPKLLQSPLLPLPLPLTLLPRWPMRSLRSLGR
jgi:hypothetical protein